MADERNAGSPATGEDSFEDASEAETVRASDLNRKVQSLEHEKLELVQETNQIKDKVEKLTAEIEEWKNKDAELKEKVEKMANEIEQGEEAKRAAESIAKRCSELEYEVGRLHHDLVASMNEATEASAETAELKKVNVEKLQKEMEELKKVNGDSEARARELEKKIWDLEMKEIEYKNQKLRAEEEMRDSIADKDEEIAGLKKKVEELDGVIAESGADDWIRQKHTLEIKLKEAEAKARNMELEIMELEKKVKGTSEVIYEFRNSTFGASNRKSSSRIGDGDGRGLKQQWPVLAMGSTGIIVAAAALVYTISYVKKR